MTYTHLTTDELVMIESYYHQNVPITKIAAYLNRTRTPIYNVVNFFKEGHTALEYYQKYKENKKRCGRRKIILSKKQQTYIKKKLLKDGLLTSLLVGLKSLLSVPFVPFTVNSKKRSLMKPRSQ